jgi:type III pantothenate kinase
MATTTTLCFDFGNTRLKYAVFKGDVQQQVVTLPGDEPAAIAAALEQFAPQKTILSSVIEHSPAVDELLAEKTQFHRLSHLTKANFTSPVGKPETIGADRLAMAAAAVHFYPGCHNLIIGLGTCITYNYINHQHQFLGGAISPGLHMRFKAMHDYTAKLPLAATDWNFPLVGYDTKTNLQSGVLAGMAFEIDGFIDAYLAKYDNFNVVLTGGDAVNFAQRLKNRIFADPNFLFKGLYALSEVNNC